ncbi:hypothetical protein G7Y79_00029g063000 [Physcia stellaris]|nr:hypothetical protein G7Y79_00029g063000 [Physcia stellaris]
MVDFLTPLPAPGPEEPMYLNVQGPNQWPDEVPYLDFVTLAEALDLESTALLKFFNDPPRNKVSLLKYPPPRSLLHSTNGVEDTTCDSQGVGPHKDGGFLTSSYRATPHACLEAQNKSGTWIPVPPIPDTLVVKRWPLLGIHDRRYLSSLKLPSHIADLVRDEKVKSDAEAFFAKYHLQSPGKGIFTARLTSHPDVGRRWYPQELQQALKGQQEFRS